MPKDFYKEISLNGKLVTKDDPTTIDTNFQSLKNMRYQDKTVIGIGGMSKINTTAVTDNPHFQNGFHFKKDQPSESHVLLQALTSGDASPKIVQIDHSSTDVPNQVDFTGGATPTALYSGTSTDVAQFSDAPNGQVAICDGTDSLIWGGDEMQIASFVNYDGNDTDLNRDYTEVLKNTLTDSENVAVLTAGTEATPLVSFYVGSTRPLQGVKFTVSTANTNSVTMNLVQYWSGSAWTAVSGKSDGTESGGKTMAQSGSITWTAATDTHKNKYVFGNLLYYYKFVTTGAFSANTALSYVTLDAPMQKIKDIWDGSFRTVVSAFTWDGGTYLDYTTNITEEDYQASVPETYMDLGLNGVGEANNAIFGFLEKANGLYFQLAQEKTNGTAGVITVQYWTGSAWADVTSFTDGTTDGTATMNSSGVVSWSNSNTEYKRSILGGVPLYYYKITYTTDLSAVDIWADRVTGIAASKVISSYKFPMFAKNRLMLCSRQDQKKNSMLVSAVDAPDVYNGDDSTEIFFGDDKELTAGINLFSRLASSIYDVTLIFKRNAMFGLTGFTPEDFQTYSISDNIGCVAPMTLKGEILEIKQGITRPIVIWQGTDGIYVFDNTSAVRISKDIDNFFDKNQSNTNKIHASYMHLSIGFIDTDNKEYHWLFADGSSSGTLNREFVFDLQRLKWYEVPRAGSKFLQCGFQVQDSIGNKYNYAGLDSGYIERLENGNDMDGTEFAQSFRLGDIAPVEGSISQLSSIIRHKIIMKDTGTAGTVAVTHYGDGKTAGTSLASAEDPTNTGYRIADVITDTNKSIDGHIFHSTEYSMTTSDANPAFAPLFVAWKVDHIGEDND